MEEVGDFAGPLLGSLEVRHVPDIVDDFQRRGWRCGMQTLGELHRKCHVLATVQYQGRPIELAQYSLGVAMLRHVAPTADEDAEGGIVEAVDAVRVNRAPAAVRIEIGRYLNASTTASKNTQSSMTARPVGFC